MSPESKWNSHMSELFTMNLSFPPLRRNLDILWSHSFLLFRVFGKWNKKMPVLIMALLSTLYCVLLQFTTVVVTTATAFSFFRSFPYFVWNFCCWQSFPHFFVFTFYKSFFKNPATRNRSRWQYLIALETDINRDAVLDE